MTHSHSKSRSHLRPNSVVVSLACFCFWFAAKFLPNWKSASFEMGQNASSFFDTFFVMSFFFGFGVESKIVGSSPNLACSARGVIPVLICTQDAHQSWEGPHICGRWRLNFEGAAPGKRRRRWTNRSENVRKIIASKYVCAKQFGHWNF